MNLLCNNQFEFVNGGCPQDKPKEVIPGTGIPLIQPMNPRPSSVSAPAQSKVCGPGFSSVQIFGQSVCITGIVKK